MGEVYRARDTKLNRDAAIKILPAHLAGEAGPGPSRTPGTDRMARFEREAQVLASLNHPHIAQIYGVEESSPTGSGQVFRAIVMELVEGEDLAGHARDRGSAARGCEGCEQPVAGAELAR